MNNKFPWLTCIYERSRLWSQILGFNIELYHTHSDEQYEYRQNVCPYFSQYLCHFYPTARFHNSHVFFQSLKTKSQLKRNIRRITALVLPCSNRKLSNPSATSADGQSRNSCLEKEDFRRYWKTQSDSWLVWWFVERQTRHQRRKTAMPGRFLPFQASMLLVLVFAISKHPSFSPQPCHLSYRIPSQELWYPPPASL